jgi:hypothetical protein
VIHNGRKFTEEGFVLDIHIYGKLDLDPINKHTTIQPMMASPPGEFFMLGNNTRSSISSQEF